MDTIPGLTHRKTNPFEMNNSHYDIQQLSGQELLALATYIYPHPDTRDRIREKEVTDWLVAALSNGYFGLDDIPKEKLREKLRKLSYIS